MPLCVRVCMYRYMQVCMHAQACTHTYTTPHKHRPHIHNKIFKKMKREHFGVSQKHSVMETPRNSQ